MCHCIEVEYPFSTCTINYLFLHHHMSFIELVLAILIFNVSKYKVTKEESCSFLSFGEAKIPRNLLTCHSFSKTCTIHNLFIHHYVFHEKSVLYKLCEERVTTFLEIIFCTIARDGLYQTHNNNKDGFPLS